MGFGRIRSKPHRVLKGLKRVREIIQVQICKPECQSKLVVEGTMLDCGLQVLNRSRGTLLRNQRRRYPNDQKQQGVEDCL